MRVVVFALVAIVLACSSKTAPPPPPCDQKCADAAALRAMREVLKLAYNLTLQGKPVGMQDAMVSCPMAGTAHIFGTATSNADQGTTEVHLTYVFTGCSYQQTGETPDKTYSINLTGTFAEDGVLAQQPTITTALTIKSDAVTIMGSISDPPIDISASMCAIAVAQDGNQLSGTLCGRMAGVTL